MMNSGGEMREESRISGGEMERRGLRRRVKKHGEEREGGRGKEGGMREGGGGGGKREKRERGREKGEVVGVFI